MILSFNFSEEYFEIVALLTLKHANKKEFTKAIANLIVIYDLGDENQVFSEVKSRVVSLHLLYLLS